MKQYDIDLYGSGGDIDTPIGLPEGEEWSAEQLEEVKAHAKKYRSEHPRPSILEQYRDKQANGLAKRPGMLNITEEQAKVVAPMYVMGWNAAIALDLPVFFHEWVDDNFLNSEDAIQKHQCADTAELYRYWLNNIYKPE